MCQSVDDSVDHIHLDKVPGCVQTDSSVNKLWVVCDVNITHDDKGLTKYLPKLKNLKTLGIQTIQGTDEGLRVAYKLPRLEEVYASGNSISPDEVQRLQDHAKKNKEKSKANKADNNEKSKAKKKASQRKLLQHFLLLNRFLQPT